MEHVERRARVQSKAEAKAVFYRHLVVYVAVNLLLVVINLVTSRDDFWAIWPLLGWGIDIAARALRVFVSGGTDRPD